MAEVTKLMYIVVVDQQQEEEEEEEEEKRDRRKNSFRYTRPVLQSTLQLMGCKARHAFKISQRVFELMRTECSGDALPSLRVKNGSKGLQQKENDYCTDACYNKSDGGNHFVSENDGISENKQFELYKRRTTVFVRRTTFLDVVCDALAEYKYVGPNQRSDLILACRFKGTKLL